VTIYWVAQSQELLLGGSAYLDGGKGWTEEEKQVADAAISLERNEEKATGAAR
jgi:hypothetical protein